MPRLIRRPAAIRDFTRHFAYLVEHAGQATAERFLEAAERTFGDLAATPLIGTPDKVREGQFAGVRLWRVRGFERYLIFIGRSPTACRLSASSMPHRIISGLPGVETQRCSLY